jgi:hypothetical protein
MYAICVNFDTCDDCSFDIDDNWNLRDIVKQADTLIQYVDRIFIIKGELKQVISTKEIVNVEGE